MTNLATRHHRSDGRLHLRRPGRGVAARGRPLLGGRRRSGTGARRVSRRAGVWLCGRAARHLARRRRRRAAGGLASASRARLRHPRLRRDDRRRRSGDCAHAGAACRGRRRRASCRPTTRCAAPPSALAAHIGAPRRAMIIYTSGTTGRPKGVVSTHATIGAQIASLVRHGSGRRAIVCCSRCRCTTCTASSTASAGRSPSAPPARCCPFDAEARLGPARLRRDHGLHRGADDLSPADRLVGRGARRTCSARGRRACGGCG